MQETLEGLRVSKVEKVKNGKRLTKTDENYWGRRTP
jgi:hypothetical protein